MTPAYTDPTVDIYQGDALETLKQLPDGAAQTCVTSPPYWGLRDYKAEGQLGLEATPAEFILKMVEIFRQVNRVLKDDGTLWLNMGDSYNAYNGNRGKAKGFNKNHLEIQPRLPQGAGLSFDGLKPKDMMGMPWRLALALQADGWFLRQDIIWHKPNPMPESVADRCTKAHEYIFLMSKREKYFYDAAAIMEPIADSTRDDRRLYNPDYQTSRPNRGYPGQASKGAGLLKSKRQKQPSGWHQAQRDPDTLFKREPTAGKGNRKSFRGGGAYAQHGVMDNSEPVENETHGNEPNETMTRNKRSVWTVSTKPFAEAHFATFPEDLIVPCILAGAPQGGVVLDPFMGAGTTARVAKDCGRRALGIELNPDYIQMAAARLRQQTLGI